MQTKYKNFLNESELSDSFKSDHEFRMENDMFVSRFFTKKLIFLMHIIEFNLIFHRIVMEKMKNDDSDLDPETINKITAADFEDASNDEFASFKFASIETGAILFHCFNCISYNLQITMF